MKYQIGVQILVSCDENDYGKQVLDGLEQRLGIE